MKRAKNNFYITLFANLVFLFLDIVLGQLGYSIGSFIFSSLGIAGWFLLLFFAKTYICGFKPNLIDLLLGLLDVIVGVLLFIEATTVIPFFAQILVKSLFAARIIKASRFSKCSIKLYIVIRGKTFIGNIVKKEIKRRLIMANTIDKLEKVKTTKLSVSQIISIIIAFIGVIFGVVSAFVPEIAIAGDMTINIGMALGIESISAYIGIFSKYAEKSEAEILKIKAKNAERAKIELSKIEASKKAENEVLEKLNTIANQVENKQ